jgi:imidazole glycerol-phosphate synthase subunit HisH
MNKTYKIAVIDYRMSNMFSIKNALNILGFEAIVTSDYKTIVSCDGAILPGVGAYPEAMKNIKELNIDYAIKDFISLGKPFVGICLGFQLLFDKSDEIEDTSGLGIISGEVKDFSKLGDKIRVPHVGWNQVKKNLVSFNSRTEDYLEIINDKDYFYFIHSNYVKPLDNSYILTTTEYAGIEFCSSIMKENIFACQFHPEKSGQRGIKFLNKIFNK